MRAGAPGVRLMVRRADVGGRRVAGGGAPRRGFAVSRGEL